MSVWDVEPDNTQGAGNGANQQREVVRRIEDLTGSDRPRGVFGLGLRHRRVSLDSRPGLE